MKTPLERLCERLNVRCESKYGAVQVPETWPQGAVGWRITLRLGRRQLTTNYYTGPAIAREPSAADVLYCLLSDASVADAGSFESFCADFGYDTDSRKAEQTYKECLKMAPRLAAFLGEHYHDFTQAEH